MNKDLIKQYLSGRLDEKKERDLLNWVNASESNRKLFAEMKNLWVSAQVDAEDLNIDTGKEYQLFRYRRDLRSKQGSKNFSGQRRNVSRRESLKKLLRVAALLVLMYSIGGTYLYIRKITQVTYSEIRTKRGEKTFLQLADGTRIWLNSESRLRYPSRVDSKKVNVFLDGEAYFDVTKNPNRKFIVNAATLDIAVLGTSFNVRSYSTDNSIVTTLEEGKISITGKMGDKYIKDPLILTPNQRVTFIKNSNEYKLTEVRDQIAEEDQPEVEVESIKKVEIKDPRILRSDNVDLKLDTSWKDGKMVFKSERLEDLALRMERWFDIQIVITDRELRNVRYTGVFEKESVEQALHALSISFPFQYEINQNEITIKK